MVGLRFDSLAGGSGMNRFDTRSCSRAPVDVDRVRPLEGVSGLGVTMDERF
jgi:hypothetical protein